MLGATFASAQDTLVYEPAGDGPGKGKHVVLLAGDEEYRSEEGLPMLAKILSQRHGFKTTVLFPLDPDGTINPDNQKSLPGAEALDSADAIVMLLRFRAWPDETMKHFADAYNRGVPIVALRTSTHAFRFRKEDESSFQNFNDFGKRVLGEGWISHWGKHKKEATRGVIELSAKENPILRGVTDVFGDSDVYEAYPPANAKILLRGQVLTGMNPDDAPADYEKQRATDKQEQGVNDPMMPVAWTRVWKNEAGKENRILTTTLGAATDLQSEDLRRLIVNGVYWGLGLDVPAKADVSYVGEYHPTMYGFKGYVKGVKPVDHALGEKPAAKQQSLLQLTDNDHIALIGNATADRMQHHGHLETLIHAKFPKHNLTFRNLAVAGDEIDFRHRSANFGSPDEWLTKVTADVIFAFFGFNESFAGEAGLPKFRAELDKLLKEMAGKNYSGKGSPRIVLFGPAAAEKHRDPNFTDPGAMNANIKLYAAAMADVARSNDVLFVDLFNPTQQLYADAAKRGESLTTNGRYLTEGTDKLLAPILFQSLFDQPAPAGDLEKLRAAVNDKNLNWHKRYRTVDGYNVYGGRSKLAFPSGKGEEKITNYHVMQEEMTQRDVLTANRDQRVWAVARGEEFVVDDSNLPPATPVPTNKPGKGAGGLHVFLSGEDAIKKMTVHAGMKVNLFASEEQFPDLVNPVQMLWDAKGRLWVSAWRNYPSRTPTSKVGDKILIFEDTDGDGRADECTTFLDDLNCPTGFQFYKDGVLVMQAPDLWFVRDTDGDGQADSKKRILMGLDSADSHHTTNSMCYEPGGAVYLSDGIFHRTQVETAEGVMRNNDGAIYRFEPRTGRFETYTPYGFVNPHGRVFDYWGNDYVTDATGNHTYFGPLISGRLDYPDKHGEVRQFWERPSRPSPGTGMLTSRHFPEEFQDNLLNLNVIGFQGIYRVKPIEDGAGMRGEKLDDLVSSEDPNFRPTAVNVGPDGAIYFADWSNAIIGHMQHHLRDPNRDQQHGRLYRITYEGRPLAQPPKIDGQPIPALLELLKEPENQTRELAKIELDKHDSAKVIPAVKQWAAKLDNSDPRYEHHLLEALWMHQWHNVVDRDLLDRMLNSTEPRARAQAVRVLCYWRDRIPEVLTLLGERAVDESPRVRLEAVRAASFFRSVEAADVALAALNHPTDYYLDYVMAETLRQLDPYWKSALAAGKPVAPHNPAGLDHLIRSIDTDELLKLPRNPSVLQALLIRPGIADAERYKALNELSESRKVTIPVILLDALDAAKDADAMTILARLLPQQHPTELKPLRARIAALTAGPRPAIVRHYAWAALATADESFDTVWPAAAKSPSGLADILGAVPLVYDPGIRAAAQPKVMPLLASNVQITVGDVRRAAIRAAASIAREPEQTFAALARLIEQGEQVPAAAAGLRALPRSAWDNARTAATADALVAWARGVPADQRTRSEYLSTTQLAQELIATLPPGKAGALIGALRELRVPFFLVGTVREQMRYDTTLLIVEAGKPFEILFENTDVMPHNLAVLNPGSRERIGKLAMTMKPDQLDNEGRAYVPADPDVLAATKMLEGGQKQTLKLTAPQKEGEYEYVCTFPDHWQVMWGKLIVTRDIDAYLQTKPEPGMPTASGASAADHAHHHPK